MPKVASKFLLFEGSWYLVQFLGFELQTKIFLKPTMDDRIITKANKALESTESNDVLTSSYWHKFVTTICETFLGTNGGAEDRITFSFNGVLDQSLDEIKLN